MMSSIKENFTKINKQIIESANSCCLNPDNIMLIAVSKKKSAPAILESINAGVKHLGENYIQEAIEKINIIGQDKACWHFIGHLQSNKAKFAIKYFEYIHTVDTFKLAKEINKQAKKISKIQKILVQVNIGKEDSKSGTSTQDTGMLVQQSSDLENVSLQGLMCMPPYFAEPEHARIYFKQLVQIKKNIIAHYSDNMPDNISMKHLSMGMSTDFKVAIEEGSTMVRIGTSIFGKRN